MKNEFQNINIENFQGPLDLLLSLIKEKKMDILNINVLAVVDEYLRIIEFLLEKDIELISEYLLMTTTLISLKSSLLLSASKNNEQEEQGIEKSLLNQLFIYNEFKKVASFLKGKEIQAKNLMIANAHNLKKFESPNEKNQLFGHMNFNLVIVALRKMLDRKKETNFQEIEIEKFDLSPLERREQILLMIKSNKDIKFNDLFKVPSMNHYVVTWLTILDMAKKQEVILEQKEPFGNIDIQVLKELKNE